jgi:hypothetical protein
MAHTPAANGRTAAFTLVGTHPLSVCRRRSFAIPAPLSPVSPLGINPTMPARQRHPRAARQLKAQFFAPDVIPAKAGTQVTGLGGCGGLCATARRTFLGCGVRPRGSDPVESAILRQRHPRGGGGSCEGAENCVAAHCAAARCPAELEAQEFVQTVRKRFTFSLNCSSSFVSHSHTTSVRHPAALSAAICWQSFSTFLLSLGPQYSRFDFGRRASRHYSVGGVRERSAQPSWIPCAIRHRRATLHGRKNISLEASRVALA